MPTHSTHYGMSIEYTELNTKDADQISFTIYNDGEEKEVIA